MKKLTLISLAVLISASCVLAGWWRTFGGAESDESTCVQQTSDGGLAVTGVTWSFGPDERNMWLIKLDSLGHKEWDKTYGWGWSFSVRQTSDSGYIMIGEQNTVKTNSSGDTLWTRPYAGRFLQKTNDGGYIVVAQKSYAVSLLKLDENGDSTWAQIYSKVGNYGDLPSWVEQTSDGGYIITGLAGDVDFEEMRERTALFLQKTDSEGNTSWIKTYGGEEWNQLDRGNCVRQTFDKGYIITGKVRGSTLLKTDSLGDTIWCQTLGGCSCVQQIPDSGYIITGGTGSSVFSGLLGNSQDNSYSLPFSSFNGGDLYLGKTDANGDTMWTRSYGGNETDAGRYVQRTFDSGYVITGYTWSYGAGNTDFFTLKTDSLGLLVVTEKPTLEVAENWGIAIPIGPKVLLRYWDTPQGFHASVFDAAGIKIDELHSSSQSGVIILGDRYSPGVYFVKPISQKKATTEKVVIVR